MFEAEDKLKIIKQGAEARLYLSEFHGQKCLVKERFVKKYRHPDLDSQLTKERIRAESKAISRCKAIDILTPKIFNADIQGRKIYMEYFEHSITVKDFINNSLSKNAEKFDINIQKLGKRIGCIIGKMHANNIIHGDLTTSNILVDSINDNKFEEYNLIMIDFGLSHYSSNIEDKGVDLYVLERALISTHSDIPKFFSYILGEYKENNPVNCTETIGKYEEVRARGRKRTMVG